MGIGCDVSFAYHGTIRAFDLVLNGKKQGRKELFGHTPGVYCRRQHTLRHSGKQWERPRNESSQHPPLQP